VSGLVRGAIFGAGVLALLGGLLLILTGPAGVPSGLWAFAVGAVLVLVPLIERQRYRSAAAEPSNLAPGPGGGEALDTPIEARFQPTSERFVDPTTGVQMQVLVDPRTGERRYVAEA
jgi:hypothetical protein